MATQNPSTGFAGSPPRQMPGRMFDRQSHPLARRRPARPHGPQAPEPARDAGADPVGQSARHRQLRGAAVGGGADRRPPRLHARHRRARARCLFWPVAIIWLWERLRPGKEGLDQARRAASRLLSRHAQPPVARFRHHLRHPAARAVLAPLVLRRHLVHHGPVDLDHADPRPRNVVARRAARQELDVGRRCGRSGRCSATSGSTRRFRRAR